MSFNLVTVGIADSCVSTPPDILRTILGSCVGICLYDEVARIGGMSHIMLPVHKSTSGEDTYKKYADTAIPALIQEMRESGASPSRLTAKIVGGARMFNVGPSSILGEIGNNNIIKVREVLANQGIRILADETGGNFGRTVDFVLDDGSVRVRSIGRQEIVL